MGVHAWGGVKHAMRRLDHDSAGFEAAHCAGEEIADADEIGDVMGGRFLVDPARRVERRDPAGLQHGDAVAEFHRLGLIMRDVEPGKADLLLHALEFEAQLAADLGIDVGERFVEQHHR